MTPYYAIGAVFGTLVFLHSENAFSSETKTQTLRLVDRINSYLSEQSYPEWRLEFDKGTEKIFRRDSPLTSLQWFYYRNHYSFKYSPKSHRVCEVMNTGLLIEKTMVNSKEIRYFPTKFDPKLSKSEAELAAREFTKVCVGEFPGNLGAGVAEFVQHSVVKDHPQEGVMFEYPFWRVIFPRIDSNGNRFQSDQLIVEIFEEFGPYFLDIELDTPYDQFAGQPISQTEAIQKSAQIARKRSTGSVLSQLFGESVSLLDTGKMSAYLEILVPNRDEQLRKARLAWVVSFETTDSASGRKGGIIVWIDAETGENLGGDGW